MLENDGTISKSQLRAVEEVSNSKASSAQILNPPTEIRNRINANFIVVYFHSSYLDMIKISLFQNNKK